MFHIPCFAPYTFSDPKQNLHVHIHAISISFVTFIFSNCSAYPFRRPDHETSIADLSITTQFNMLDCQYET